MTHRPILTQRQRDDLTSLLTDESSMLTHYVLSDEDITLIKKKRDKNSQLGFALQLCAFRYPGRYLSANDILPLEFVIFIGAQIGISKNDLSKFAYKPVTRYEHLRALQKHYGYKPFHLSEANFSAWLIQAAIETRNNADLAILFTEECRRHKIILPGMTVIERLCADARVTAERKIVDLISSRISEEIRKTLNSILEETVDGRLTRYGWLRRFEVGHNSADANRLLEKLEYLQKLEVPESLLEGIPTHRVLWLQQQGEAYYADGLRDLKEERKLAILATCVIRWRALIIDVILETHDRIVGKIYNDCKRQRDSQLSNHKKLVNETLESFVVLSEKLLEIHESKAPVTDVIKDKKELETLTGTARELTKKLGNDPLDYALLGYGKFRRYAKRLLENIIFDGNKGSQPLLEAINLLKTLNQSGSQENTNFPIDFSAEKWRQRLNSEPERKLWETAVLFTIREALRSRDIWVNKSEAYQDTRKQLLTIHQAKETISLPIPLQGKSWVKERQLLLKKKIKQVSQMIRQGTLPNSYIDKGKIRVRRLERLIPKGMDDVTLTIYGQMPEISITDILREVDEDTGFTDCFNHIHTGSTCGDKVGLLNVLLAGGINMGLKKMALCSSSHSSVWPLRRISNWYVTSESMTTALEVIIEKHKDLPLSSAWGDGSTSSSDGQFFSAGGAGEAMNVINTKYGMVPGFKGYTHVSDQYGPFAVKTIPSTAHEAPYILDGLTMNDTGRRIKEHYSDTGGFTDHVFALCALLGYQFSPRLRNLSSLNLYGVRGMAIPKTLKELIKPTVNINRIEQQWPDILRLVASIMTHKVIPSDILRQLASFSRQNDLAIALREIGRIERTLFILTWISSVALQRRSQTGINKGEAHHSLKRALNFNRKGEISDRTSENQHLRMMHLNLLAAIIIYWNTKHLALVVDRMEKQGTKIPPEKLTLLSPLGWEHIILTGFYKW